MLALLAYAYPFHFLHKAWLLFNYKPDCKWRTWAGLRNGKQRAIDSAPTLWGKDEWVLAGGILVRSREIDVMLDRSEYGYE